MPFAYFEFEKNKAILNLGGGKRILFICRKCSAVYYLEKGMEWHVKTCAGKLSMNQESMKTQKME